MSRRSRRAEIEDESLPFILGGGGYAFTELTEPLPESPRIEGFVRNGRDKRKGNTRANSRKRANSSRSDRGGKESAKHANKRLMLGRGSVGKQPVLGFRERGGHTKAMPIASTDLPKPPKATKKKRKQNENNPATLR